MSLIKRIRNTLKLYFQFRSCKKVASLKNISAEQLFIADSKVLVIAPHPDDEVIGCFGLIDESMHADVLVLSDGRNGFVDGTSKDKVCEIRSQELLSAMSHFDNVAVKQLSFEDGKLFGNFSLLDNITFDEYDIIAVPNIFDYHMDHRAVALTVVERIRKMVSAKPRIVLYEVWGTNPYSNRYIDISESIDKKIKVIREYSSQTSVINYDERIKALNYYRGMCFGVNYAEGYLELSYKQFKDLVKTIV